MISEINKFTIRVYGVLVNNNHEVLLVHERMPTMEFTKFPGGGLEFGEGTLECIKREFKEETNIDVEVIRHLYTTDFFQQSAFRKTDQLMAIYYLLKPLSDCQNLPIDEIQVEIGGRIEYLRFFWVDIKELKESMVDFPIDKILISKINNHEFGKLA